MGLVAQCNCSTYNECVSICDSATHANVQEATSSITLSWDPKHGWDNRLYTASQLFSIY